MTEDKKVRRAAAPSTAPSFATSGARGTVANAGWNSFATVWGIAIGFLLTPVLIHKLGTSQYGILLLIWSITGILSITSFGLGEATLRYVAHYHGGRDLPGINRVLRSTLSFFVVMSGAVMVALLMGAPSIVAWLNIPVEQHRLVTGLLRLTGVVFALQITTNAIGAVPRALQRWDIASKISIALSVVRGGGYIGLAFAGFGILHIVVWDLLLASIALVVMVMVTRQLLPGVRLSPSFSFAGLREVMGYSVFSCLTWAFHMLHRESGKLLVARFVGATPVAYLGAPDNLGQRIHAVVASGAEALMPRFSANRDPNVARRLFWYGTWSALAVSLILFVPFFVLVPDFLRLWISPEFGTESGMVGRLLAVYLISQGMFAPVATFYRGTGKPWFVTVVILGSLIITLAMGLLLIPTYGVLGAAYAYLAGSLAPFLGVVLGSLYAFGASALRPLLRMVGWPLTGGVLSCTAGMVIRGLFGELRWHELFVQGGLVMLLTAVIVIGGDLLIGGDHSPSRDFLDRLAKSRKFTTLARLIPLRRPS